MSDASRKNTDRLRKLLARTRQRVSEITPEQARSLIDQGGLLIDVRESREHADGVVPGAHTIERGMLELEIERAVDEVDRPLVLMCAGGDRSALAAASLGEMGYRQVHNLSGGFTAWRNAGLPVEMPDHDESSRLSRYLRHLAIDEVGQAGQRKLLDSRVFITGAGGLGSPVALYLAAAGVGSITIVDSDRVERTNLQRQILHSDHLVGHRKVHSAAQRLNALNPEIEIRAIDCRLEDENVDGLIADHDVVVDGSDNFPTRYCLNDACVRLGLPMIYGAVLRFRGQVGVFRAGDGKAPCYRCLFPEPPLAGDAPSCAEAGVLGVMPGVIGTLQANETLKLLLGIGEPLVSQLLHFDALTSRFRTTRLVRDPECRTCR